VQRTRVALSLLVFLFSQLSIAACNRSSSGKRSLLSAVDQSTTHSTSTVLEMRSNRTRARVRHGFGLKGFRNIKGLATDPRSGTVFGFDAEVGQLLKLDPVTGEVTPVGAVGFSGVSGLAFDPKGGGVLYAVDDETDQLLTIDTRTGAGTPVGLLDFSDADGLAVDSDTSTLYASDQALGLFAISPISGAGVQLPGSAGVGTLSGLTFDPETDTLYGIDRDAHELLTFDPITGQVLSSRALMPDSEIEGLALDPGTGLLLASDLSDASLQDLDPATGALTLIEKVGFDPAAGLDFDAATGEFVGINETAGVCQVIGIDPETGAGRLRAELVDPVGAIAFDTNTGTLYGIHVSTNQLAVVDPDTGVTTDVGPLGGFAEPVGALAFDPAGNQFYLTFEASGIDPVFTFHAGTSTLTQIGPTGFFDVQGLALDRDTGMLYAIERDAGQILTLDRVSGAGTVIGRSGLGSAAALAFDAETGALCGIDDHLDHLFRFDVQTGAATGIGALGFDEGLASLDYDRNTRTLYASLDLDESLVRIDPRTGVATFIGRTISGLGEGLAFDPATATLYTVDPERKLLVSLSLVTGARTDIGRTGVRDLQGLAFDPNTGTLFGIDTATGNLVTLDTNTGSASAVGFSGVGPNLAFDPDTNKLYGISGPSLFEIDPSTGFTSLVAPISGPVGNVVGLAFDPLGPIGVLYAMSDSGALFAVNPATAVAVLLGSETRDVRGLSFDPITGTLFGIDQLRDQLVSVSATTGASQTIASLGFKDITGLAFDPNTNTLFGVEEVSDQLLVFDRITGTAQAVGPTGLSIRGLAFDPNTDTLYATDGAALLTLDAGTGAPTSLGAFTGTGVAESLAFDAKTRRIHAILDAPPGQVDTLVTLDPVTFVQKLTPIPTRRNTGLAVRR